MESVYLKVVFKMKTDNSSTDTMYNFESMDITYNFEFDASETIVNAWDVIESTRINLVDVLPVECSVEFLKVIWSKKYG